MTFPATETLNLRLTQFAGALLGITMLLLIHRNWGIDHDAALYLGTALLQQQPDIFSRDLFFAFGSQGDYTIFPWLTGYLLTWFQPVAIFFWGGLIGLLFFAWVSWYCVSQLLEPKWHYIAWLGLLCLPTSYGQTTIFSYAEPFLTPRPFAEGFSLLAIGLFTKGRYKFAIVSLLAAALFHPLQAVGAALVIFPWLVLQNHRWLHVLWLAIPPLIAGIYGLHPFDGMFQPLDAYWYGELDNLHQHLFITSWSQQNFQLVLFDTYLLIYAWRIWKQGFGEWCLAAIIGLALGIIANLLLVDWLHLVLPTGLQLWRAHWLAHWLAMASLALLLVRDWKINPIHSLSLALAAFFALAQHDWIWIVFASLHLALPLLNSRLQPRAKRLLFVIFSAALALLFAYQAALAWVAFGVQQYRWDAFPFDQKIISIPLIALSISFLAAHIWQRTKHQLQWLLVFGLLLPCLAFAAIRWDSRSPMRKAYEPLAGHSDIFHTPLPQNAQIFWDDGNIVQTWLVLGRADYYDPQQLSGIAFQRGTIVEARKRITKLTPLYDALDVCNMRPLADAIRPCIIPASDVAGVCSTIGTQPPDYLILHHPLSVTALGTWAPVDPMNKLPLTRYFLYSCKQVATTTSIKGPQKAPRSRLY